MKNTQHITKVLLGSTSTTVLLTSETQCGHFTLQILALPCVQDYQGVDITTYHIPCKQNTASGLTQTVFCFLKKNIFSIHEKYKFT